MDEFLSEFGQLAEIRGNGQEPFLEEDPQVGEKVAAGYAIAAEGILARVGAGCDGDGQEPGSEVGVLEDLDDRRAPQAASPVNVPSASRPIGVTPRTASRAIGPNTCG